MKRQREDEERDLAQQLDRVFGLLAVSPALAELSEEWATQQESRRQEARRLHQRAL